MVMGRDGDRFRLEAVACKKEEVLLWRLFEGGLRLDSKPVQVRGRLDYGSGRVIEVVGFDDNGAIRLLFLPDTVVLSDRGCVIIAKLEAGDLLLPGNMKVSRTTPLYVKARCISLSGSGAGFCNVDGVFAMLGVRV